VAPLDVANEVKAWSDFERLFMEAGTSINGWSRQQTDDLLRLLLGQIQCIGKPETTRIEWRIGKLVAVRQKRVDRKTGKINTEPAAAVA
jgi:hypothetical protein